MSVITKPLKSAVGAFYFFIFVIKFSYAFLFIFFPDIPLSVPITEVLIKAYAQASLCYC